MLSVGIYDGNWWCGVYGVILMFKVKKCIDKCVLGSNILGCKMLFSLFN